MGPSIEDFNLNSLIMQIISSMQSGNSANLYTYIIDALTNSSVRQNNHQSNMDLSWLDEYIQKTVSESIKNQLQEYSDQDGKSAVDDSNIGALSEANHMENNVPQQAVQDVQAILEKNESDSLTRLNDELIKNLYGNSSAKIPASSDYQEKNAPSGMERITINIKPQIIETNNSFIVRINISEGDDESKLNVHIYRDHLTVKVGSRLLEHVIPVPENINSEYASASVKNHVLEINIPKEQDENPRYININKD